MMADHMEEPPQKRMKVDDLYMLEENLPDELVSTWGDQLGGGGPGSGPVSGGGPPNHGMAVNVGGVGGPNKPPAQGPGPGGAGGPQLNGSVDDVNSAGGGPGGNPLRQMQHHQHLQHLLQQQVCHVFHLLYVFHLLKPKKWLTFDNRLYNYISQHIYFRVTKILAWLAIQWEQLS